MIVYEPEVELKMPRPVRPRRRELTRFLSAAVDATDLRGEVDVLLTGDAQVQEFNRNYRRKDKPTDVLSFPAAEPSAGVAGDLVISLDMAYRQAVERGHPLETEIKVLLLHGLLHLAGYDHERDNGEMHRREAKLRRKLGLPAGLIERVQTKPITLRSAALRPSRQGPSRQAVRA